MSAATRLCLPDSGVCGTFSDFNCPDSCKSSSPFHCGGYALYVCGQPGIDALNQILDAGQCADLLPTAFGPEICDAYYDPEPK